ncbi:MAG: hypothetical protein QM831_10710 [Kofleriaceae bacterium]
MTLVIDEGKPAPLDHVTPNRGVVTPRVNRAAFASRRSALDIARLV